MKHKKPKFTLKDLQDIWDALHAVTCRCPGDSKRAQKIKDKIMKFWERRGSCG